MGVLLDEKSSIGQFVSERNRGRQYDYVHTAFRISQNVPEFEIDKEFLCALNFYAVQYLSAQPGGYRLRYDVDIRGAKHTPPRWQEVEGLMEKFLLDVERYWNDMGNFELSAFVLWRVCHIHPFAQGNGRTARAICHYVMSKKLSFWPPGKLTVMELIRQNRPEYCRLLSDMDDNMDGNGIPDLQPMAEYLSRLFAIQLREARREAERQLH